MFIDLVQIKVKAGHGGNGLVSFRREKYVDRGGPNGGNGGNGGSVIFRASKDEYDLAKFRFTRVIKANNGGHGGSSKKTGASGEDIIIDIPRGTLLTESESGQIIADLINDRQEVMVACGGLGGFGNAHFKTSVQRAPLVAEKGLKGEEKSLQCELKLLAEVGLVGLPNAGKSTFLQAVSQARPKIGAYPFTTLEPHLGVSRNNCLIADIPGLIEGAAKGKGLGHQFLRHIERNLVILHLLDCQQKDLAKSYQQIISELKAYNPELEKRPQILALTKVEMLSEEILKKKLAQLKKVVGTKIKIYQISSLTNHNLDQLLKDLKVKIIKERNRLKKIESKVEKKSMPVFKISQTKDSFLIERKDKGSFLILGPKIEIFAQKTDFNNYHSRQRLLNIMSKMGISRKLITAGYKDELIIFGQEEIGDLYLNEPQPTDIKT